MAVTWSITGTEYNTDSDKGVVHAAWSATETDGDHAGSVSGMESFYPDASAESYIAYDSLTEANVLGWVKNLLGEDEVARVETKVADQITKSKTPPTAWGVPWS
jgi:hypothetical protein